ncbi:hypothetical protein L484_005897 [Morus notabilis]|uniref:Uncharacterized protein n=1 Tax=Morus notabilis TaxID=981085 RepID=W9QJ67_9ROSA|nr:hypothetical protein L484_005897 [Morus notabilis]
MNTETSHQKKLVRRHYHLNHHKLRKSPSLKFPENSSSSSSANDPPIADFDIPRYTSLRDLKEGKDFSSHFKNRRIKSAASPYLQPSALCLTDRNQNIFASFWEKLNRKKAALCSCWRAYVRDPIRACFHPIVRFFLRMVQ